MFTRMDQSTKQEWEHISEQHMPHIFDMPNRIMGMLKQLQALTLGFSTDQLHHALQTATMARRAGAEDERGADAEFGDAGQRDGGDAKEDARTGREGGEDGPGEVAGILLCTG